MNNTQRMVVEEFLEEWQHKLDSDPYTVAIRDVVSNPDKGVISTFTEYIDGISLQVVNS